MIGDSVGTDDSVFTLHFDFHGVLRQRILLQSQKVQSYSGHIDSLDDGCLDFIWFDIFSAAVDWGDFRATAPGEKHYEAEPDS